MSGQTNLTDLIAGMDPVLAPETFVFATVSIDFNWSDLSPKMIFQEDEGTSLILERSQAQDRGLAYEFPCRMITLNIHSALDAVGFLALITTKLARQSMGVNPVAGFYHDHLFVPEDKAADAMETLNLMISG